ncbi:MAG TPA: fasciclin domain-containing protein [Parafilimonas sp.]|nr:fasciclin domain-containing protein [Parafilimonas sp.]
MKPKSTSLLTVAAFIIFLFSDCNSEQNTTQDNATTVAAAQDGGQSTVSDDVSQKNVVQIAQGSKDHSTLVKAVIAGELVDALSNAGPFTVFAPTNEAFDKLPAGTLNNLLKPESKSDLQNILQYHVSLGVFKTENLHDGQTLGQVNGDNITVTVKDGKIIVNGTANVIASIPASNGIIHVIDAVLLPQAKK